MAIGVTDIRDIERYAQVWKDLGLDRYPPPDAALVTEINREHSAADVDWPEGYWLARHGDTWVLWVFNPDDDHDAGSVFFPGAWSTGAGPGDEGETARTLLAAYWGRLGDSGLGNGFEQVLAEGLVSYAEAVAIATRVWPAADPALRPGEPPAGPTLRAQLCAARMILSVRERPPYLVDVPDASADFLPGVSFGSAIVSWAFGEPLDRVCILWLVPAAEQYLLGVSTTTGGGISGVVYGCLPGEGAQGFLPPALAALFERNGHPQRPLFPERPVAVMHADNAPGGMQDPALLAEEAAALFARAFSSEPGRPFDVWFREVTEPSRVQGLGRIG